jgi:hypothetical protein
VSSPPSVETGPWECVEEWTEVALDVSLIRVEAHNAVYERPAFREEVEDLLPAHVGQSMRAIFTTGLSLDPPLPGSEPPEAIFGVAARYARREFRTSLAEDGLLGVERTGAKEMRLRGRHTAKAFQYDAAYPLEADAPGASGDPRLAVRVWAAIWPTTDSFAMAGGVYPLEDLSTALDRAGVEADPGVTVEAQPGGDRREVFDRVREAADGTR